MVRKSLNSNFLKLLTILLLSFIGIFSCVKIKRELNFETGIVTDITSHSAKVTGNIIDLGEYEIIDHGHHWYSVTGNPQASETSLGLKQSPGSFTSLLQDLQPGTEYKITSYVENSNNEVFLMETAISFKTLTINPPTVTTGTTTATSSTTATSGGNVTSDGGAEVIDKGVCWSTSPNPTTSDSKTSNGRGTGSFTSTLIGLSDGTTYYVRAFASNNAGTSYGEQDNFITPVTDVEGNIYQTVTIGTQVWMTENLKTTKLRDGTPITFINEEGCDFGSDTEPRFCWYDFNDSNKEIYGAMYNWPAVNTKKLCPAGWHAPSDIEWQVLEVYLGMSQVDAESFGYRGTDEGYKLKSVEGWSFNGNGSNSSSFNALPGGYRWGDCSGFSDIGFMGNWWTSTTTEYPLALNRFISAYESGIGRNYYNHIGDACSVRCLKD